MKPTLKILVLEDNQSDADLLQRELKQSGLDFTFEVVQTRNDFEYALVHFAPDIILSDYTLPSFDAGSAFKMKQNINAQIPFIIVSGTIGEENVVDLIKNGVTDYASKDKLSTLTPKIHRALQNASDRKEKIIIAEKLKEQSEALIAANKELVFQVEEKEKRASDLAVLSEVLLAQKEELKIANERLKDKAALLQQQEENLIRINEGLEIRVSERTVELQNLNHELKDLNISKDKFLMVISHDLRNPLTSLLLASAALTKHTEPAIFDQIQTFVKIVHSSSNNILYQLNELVDWAKSQHEKTGLKKESLPLFSAVANSFELLNATAILKNIVLENNVPSEIFVHADALMLRSILQNLVTNSIKYSLNGAVVTVTATCTDAQAEICVSDVGMGMDVKTRDNLFLPKNNTSCPGTNNETGSGLGWTLVKDFVSQHEGILRVETEPGKGTAVFFTIPHKIVEMSTVNA